MRLIDADALMPQAEYKGKYDVVSAMDISSAPTIDAVPVVRCRECKRWERLEFSPLHFCPEVHEFTGAEFFCKWGRRREDGDGDG